MLPRTNSPPFSHRLCSLRSYFGNQSDALGSHYHPSFATGYDLFEVLLQLQPEIKEQLLQLFIEDKPFKTVWGAVSSHVGPDGWNCPDKRRACPPPGNHRYSRNHFRAEGVALFYGDCMGGSRVCVRTPIGTYGPSEGVR